MQKIGRNSNSIIVDSELGTVQHIINRAVVLVLPYYEVKRHLFVID